MAKKRRKGTTKATGRDYSYDTRYESSPEQKRRRAKRNAARAAMRHMGLVHKGDGKDVHHKRGMSNSRGNLRVMGRGKNRSIK